MSDVKKRCAACRKEKPVSEMKVCMHSQMHYYVCDSKCMHDFYNPPKAEKTGHAAIIAALQSTLSAAETERDQLRAELEAIRGQQVVGRVHHNKEHAEPVRAVLNSIGRQLPDNAPLYALPPQQPDAVSVPRELLDKLLHAEAECLHGQFEEALESLRTLSTKNAEEGE